MRSDDTSLYKKVRISDICEVFDGPHATPKKTELGPVYLGIDSITDDGHINPAGFNHLSSDDYKIWTKRVVPQENDVVFTYEATLGRYALIPKDFYGCLGRRIALVRAKDDSINPRWLLYYFLSPGWKSFIDSRTVIGSTVNRIPIKAFPDYEIDMPPRNIQDKIASILGDIDDRIETNKKLNDNLERQSRAIFAQEFLSFQGLPAGWREDSLLGIADYLNGLAMQKYRPKDGENGLPVLKIKELRQGICDSNSELCSPSIKNEYIVHDGDVIFSWSGSLLVDFWCGGMCGLNQHLFKVTSSAYDKWFYYAWTNYHLQEFVAIAADKATTMGHIKREELSKAKVLVSSKAEYDRIGALLAPIYDLIIANRIENRKLAELRNQLLPRLMSGELDVSDIDL